MKSGWILLLLLAPVWAQTVTRLHSYGPANPELVERQIRALVPEGPRVSMNLAARQVIVVATPEVQEKVAAMVEQLAKPPMELRFRIQLNQEVRQVAVLSGAPFSMPLSSDPPAEVIQLGRNRLLPEHGNLPVVASALTLHATLLKEDPVIARIRVTPAVVFGVLKPYQVVEFPEYVQDVLVNDQEFIALEKKLRTNSFYRSFLRTHTEPTMAPKPVGILLSMEAVPVGTAP